MSTTANNNEDLELEEGEIAEDSNDDDLDGIRDAGGGGGGGAVGEGLPQKKRKKVVRKVRRKIKVKKKVVRKPQSQAQLQPQIQSHLQSQPHPYPHPQVQSQPQTQLQTQLQPLPLLQPLPQLQPQPQSQPQLQPQSNQIDSLWEQQILMFEEYQQAQILRAAATDEDLRIFVPTVVASTPSSPDDEKSSYEAITKMLNLLRSSANVSDSSENTKGSIEYTLIPILVEGIDYTKYKLLSQYEPKFKNDPRLNVQT